MEKQLLNDLDDGMGSEPAEQQKKTPRILRILIEFAIAFVFALIITWILKSFVIEPYEVPTGSMESTIMTGDKLLAEKVTLHWDSVRNGDIVVFADKVLPGRILVKRVIATGGQVVDIKDGLVYVDGDPLFEPYTNGIPSHPLTQQFEDTLIEYPYQVPVGHLWVMGDNRGNSTDSRYFGTVTEESVYGRAVMVFWPFEDFGLL